MITINNIMAAPGLEDLAVMAGRNGLDREVRTVTVLDAPDGPKWLKGNELILSSAYLFENNSQLLKEYVSDLINVGASGFGIKMGRFVDGIPKEVAALADQWDFPILKIPYKLVWTDVIAPFYQLRYGLEEAPLPARIEPEAIGPIVEAGKLGPRRLMSCLSRLFALPMLLAAKDGEITEDNGLDGADKLMQLSRDSAYFPENAGKEIARLGEFYVLSYQVPVRRKDQPKYLIVGGGSREALRELGRLFELLTVLVGDGGAERQDEDCLYRYFLTRLVGGRLSREDIAAF
ncbi:MAG: PucR family transcriptional regulator ligand-binding domain-containing protein, partial [Peptococcaceae bacterium]|nr:PucR family transcriptional regulator ligand-binding domain-containing protein [Peptococcaceae bacterium]